MAYVREQQIKRGDKTYRYYQLVRGYRENGKVKIEVLKHLGRFDSKAEAQAAAGVVTKSNQVPEGESPVEGSNPFHWLSPDILNADDAVLRKMRKRLRSDALRSRRVLEEAENAIGLTDNDWRTIEEISEKLEYLTHDADVLSDVLKRRRLSAGS
jgi:hypothetical protein